MADNVLTYGGLSMGAGTDYKILALEGFDSSPEATAQVSDQTEAHGAFVGTQFYGPRTVRVRLAVVGATRSALNANLDALRAVTSLLGADTEDSALTWDEAGRVSRFVLARCVQRTIPRTPSPRYAECLLDFVASDPRIYSTTTTTTDVPADGVTQVAVGNAGTFPAPFVAAFYGPATSASYRLIDDARSMSWDIQITLSTGHHVDLDGLARTAIRSTDGASVRSNVSRWDRGMDIPPGGTQFRASASGTSGATLVKIVTYHDVWM